MTGPPLQSACCPQQEGPPGTNEGKKHLIEALLRSRGPTTGEGGRPGQAREGDARGVGGKTRTCACGVGCVGVWVWVCGCVGVCGVGCGVWDVVFGILIAGYVGVGCVDCVARECGHGCAAWVWHGNVDMTRCQGAASPHLPLSDPVATLASTGTSYVQGMPYVSDKA